MNQSIKSFVAIFVVLHLYIPTCLGSIYGKKQSDLKIASFPESSDQKNPYIRSFSKAERRVKSDRATWAIRFVEEGRKGSKIEEVYTKAKKSEEEILKYLRSKGFTQDEITIHPIEKELSSTAKMYVSNTEGKDEEKSIRLGGEIEVSTNKVDLVAAAHTDVSQLLLIGVPISDSFPRYYLDTLDEIETELTQEAIAKARKNGEVIAASTGDKILGLLSARKERVMVYDVAAHSKNMKLYKDVSVSVRVKFSVSKSKPSQ